MRENTCFFKNHQNVSSENNENALSLIWNILMAMIISILFSID